ncbi:MAG: MFS transporter [Anaerolineae bacterium]
MDSVKADKAPSRDVNPYQLLYSLMFPAIVMPLAGWMFSVALPTIKADFQIPADVAAWIATVFSLPFMILMPVYGRVSDGLGKRRLLLFGISVFAGGGVVAFLSTNMQMLLIGRFIQGLGAAGLVPLALALISEVFPAEERGKAMGAWSTVGPVTGVVGPVLAGFIVANWGWRTSFLPSVFMSVAALAAVYSFIPSSNRKIDISFLQRFDWVGVGLLASTLTFLLFYLSSRPITGIAPLQDWRLFGATVLFGIAFVAYERNKANPFIKLSILNNRSLVVGSFGACLRMISLSGGMGFIMPLYLANVVGLTPRQSGFYLMLNPAAMIIFVRFGGSVSDRVGSRKIVMTGFGIFAVVMFSLSRLTGATPSYILWGVLILFGVGAGLMLASLHRAALTGIADADLGTSSGIYSMIRFLGSALGAAVGGILLQANFDRFGADALEAYQTVFIWFFGFALLGLLVANFLPRVAAAD